MKSFQILEKRKKQNRQKQINIVTVFLFCLMTLLSASILKRFEARSQSRCNAAETSAL